MGLVGSHAPDSRDTPLARTLSHAIPDCYTAGECGPHFPAVTLRLKGGAWIVGEEAVSLHHIILPSRQLYWWSRSPPCPLCLYSHTTFSFSHTSPLPPAQLHFLLLPTTHSFTLFFPSTSIFWGLLQAGIPLGNGDWRVNKKRQNLYPLGIEVKRQEKN